MKQLLFLFFFIQQIISKNSFKKISINYFGQRVSKKKIQKIIDESISILEMKQKLQKLNFENININYDEDLKELVVDLKDSINIKNLEFLVNSKEENLNKTQIYSKNDYELFSYYKNYFGATKLPENLQDIKQSDIKKSIKNLQNYFLNLGYKNVEIGYSLTYNKNLAYDLKYFINLGEKYEEFELNFQGIELGEEKFFSQHFPTLNSLYESFIFSQYFLMQGYSFCSLIKQHFNNLGYFDIKVKFFISEKNNKKILNYFINKGERYSIESFEFHFNDIAEKKIKIDLTGFYDQEVLQKTIKKIYQTYGDEKISLTFKKRIIDNNKIHLDFYITNVKNNEKILSNIKISGNFLTKLKTILKASPKKIGDLIDFSDINEIESALISLNIFESVEVNLQEKKDDTYELIIAVKEKNSDEFAGQMNASGIKNISCDLSIKYGNSNGEGVARLGKISINSTSFSLEFSSSKFLFGDISTSAGFLFSKDFKSILGKNEFLDKKVEAGEKVEEEEENSLDYLIAKTLISVYKEYIFGNYSLRFTLASLFFPNVNVENISNENKENFKKLFEKFQEKQIELTINFGSQFAQSNYRAASDIFCVITNKNIFCGFEFSLKSQYHLSYNKSSKIVFDFQCGLKQSVIGEYSWHNNFKEVEILRGFKNIGTYHEFNINGKAKKLFLGGKVYYGFSLEYVWQPKILDLISSYCYFYAGIYSGNLLDFSNISDIKNSQKEFKINKTRVMASAGFRFIISYFVMNFGWYIPLNKEIGDLYKTSYKNGSFSFAPSFSIQLSFLS